MVWQTRLPTPQEPSLGALGTDRPPSRSAMTARMLQLFRRAALGSAAPNAVAAQPGIDSPVRREPFISSLAKGQPGAARSTAHSSAEDESRGLGQGRQEAAQGHRHDRLIPPALAPHTINFSHRSEAPGPPLIGRRPLGPPSQLISTFIPDALPDAVAAARPRRAVAAHEGPRVVDNRYAGGRTYV